MSTFIRDFFADDSGAAAAEYVLILAIIGAGVGGGAYYLGDKIKTALSDAGNKIATCGVNQGSSTGC